MKPPTTAPSAVPRMVNRLAFLLGNAGLVLATTPRPDLAAPAADLYRVGFGANELQPRTPRALEFAARPNTVWVRLGVYWEVVEPSPGVFDWSGYDPVVAGASGGDLGVLGSWPTPRPGAPRRPATQRSIPPHHPPQDLLAWSEYVSAVAQRYGTDIQYWEVWNEPDLAEFWNTTPAQDAALPAVTHHTIKRVDPTVTVVLGGPAFRVLPLLFGVIPAALALAIARDRLFDIDLVLGSTLLYGSLTAILALAFLGSVLLLQQLLKSLIGGPTELAVAGAALVNGLLVQPLRRRLEERLDRRRHRRRWARAAALAAFCASLQTEELPPEVLERRLLAIVGQTLQPVSLGVWLRDAEEG